MTNDRDYFRRRAAQEAAIARHANDERASSIHQQLASAYLRRVTELGDPVPAGQLVSSL